MAVGIFIMVLDFCITGVRSPGGKIPPKPHPSGSAPVRCSGAKPGSGKGPGHSPLQFQSGCRSQCWTEYRQGAGKEPILLAHHKGLYVALGTGFWRAPACYLPDSVPVGPLLPQIVRGLAQGGLGGSLGAGLICLCQQRVKKRFLKFQSLGIAFFRSAP